MDINRSIVRDFQEASLKMRGPSLLPTLWNADVVAKAPTATLGSEATWQSTTPGFLLTLELLADPACPSIVCALQGSHMAAGLVFAFVSLCFEKQSIVYISVYAISS